MSGIAFVLKVLLSHWRAHPMQLATLLIGLMAATALWSGVQALNQQARISYERAAAIFGGARTPALVAKDGATFSQNLFVDLRRAGWAVSPLLEGRVQIGTRTFRLIGVDPVTLPAQTGPAAAMSPASLEAFLLPPHQTLIAPDTLTDSGLQAGARPQLQDGTTLPPLTVAADLAPGVLVTDIGIAQRILHRPGQVSRLLIAPQSIGPAVPLQDVAGDLLERVAPTDESSLERLTDSFHLNLTAFGFLSFAVGLFIVNSAIGLTFEQRLPMLRTLRACGVSSVTLNAVMVIELVALALAAGLAGLLAGSLIAAALLPNVAASLHGLYGAQIADHLVLKPAWWIAGFAMSIGGTLAAAFASFVKLRRLSLLDAAQPYAWKQTQQAWLRWQSAIAALIFVAGVAALIFGSSLGAGFTVLGALMLGAALALPALLALLLWAGERCTAAWWPQRPIAKWFWADSRQQLSGLSLALMALLLALAVNVGVGTMVGSFRVTFLTWLDGRLTADLYLNAATEAQAADIKAWLDQRLEPVTILPAARSETTWRDAPVELFGLADHAATAARWPLLDAAPGAWKAIRTGDAAFVSEQLARRSGIKLNDTLHLPTPQGDWPVKVAGIYADYGNPKGQVAVDVAALLRHFPHIPQTRFALLAPQAALPELAAALRNRFHLSDRQLADQSAVKAESRQIFERTFAVTAALNTFTLGVAAIALLTSLLTLSAARLPQLAPLWAIGMTLPRLTLIELAKTMALALITAILAIPLGLLVGWCLLAVVNVRAFGWRLPLQTFPLQLMELVGIAMAAALLATAIPMRRLFRMPPAALIRIFANER